MIGNLYWREIATLVIENHALGFGAARLLRESNTVTYIRIHKYHLTQNEATSKWEAVFADHSFSESTCCFVAFLRHFEWSFEHAKSAQEKILSVCNRHISPSHQINQQPKQQKSRKHNPFLIFRFKFMLKRKYHDLFFETS